MRKATTTTKIQQDKVQKAVINSLSLDQSTIDKVRASFNTRLLNAMAVQTDNNTFQLQLSESEKVAIRFVAQTVFVVGGTVKKTFDMAQKADLKAIVDLIDNSYYNVVSKGIVPKQPTTQVVKPATNKEGEKTMATYINVTKFKASLTKNGWTEKKGVFSKGDCSIAFQKAQVILNGPESNQKIPLTKCTDSQLAKLIQAMVKGAAIAFVAEEGLTQPSAVPVAPVNTTVPAEGVREQSPAKQQTEVGAKGPGKAKSDKVVPTVPAVKVAPKQPENPSKGHPTFDLLAKAVEVTEKTEKEVVSIWQPIADKYVFSVSGLIADLHKEGMWPNKTDKDGVPFEVDGYTVPAGYKGAYEAEKANGLTGAGHMVNRAARMFSKLNPNAFKKDPTKETAKTAVKSTVDEKSVDKILAEMSRLAAKLKLEDLKSWLETDKSVIAAMDESDPLESLNEENDLLSALN